MAGSTGAVGLEIAACIAVGYFGGRWLDRKFGTEPWFFWILFVGGIGAAIKALVRVTKEYGRSLKEEDEGKQPPKN